MRAGIAALMLAVASCQPAFAAAPVSEAPSTGFSPAFSVGGAAQAAGNAFEAVCTVAGTVTVTALDGSTDTWPVAVGFQVWKVAIKQVSSVAGATCVFRNWLVQ